MLKSKWLDRIFFHRSVECGQLGGSTSGSTGTMGDADRGNEGAVELKRTHNIHAGNYQSAYALLKIYSYP